jgi:non-homologous end joining protein Ku
MPDEFADAVRELVQAKVEQRRPEVALAPDGKAPKVINIMAALKQSVEAKGRAKVKEAARTRSGKSPMSPSAPKRKPSRDQRRSIH